MFLARGTVITSDAMLSQKDNAKAIVANESSIGIHDFAETIGKEEKSMLIESVSQRRNLAECLFCGLANCVNFLRFGR